MNLAEYAKLRGCSAAAVTRAVQSGRLKHCVVMVNGKPKIGDVALANREWDMNTKAAHRTPGTGGHFVENGIRPPAIVAVPDIPAPAGFVTGHEIDPSTGFPHTSVSRAKKEHYDAISAQLKADEAAGTLVNREEVRRAAFDTARQVRDSLLLIEDRLADQLAAINDPAVIRVLLRDEFRAALEALSNAVAEDDSTAAA